MSVVTPIGTLCTQKEYDDLLRTANSSMQWKKLSDEKPTEEGNYLIYRSDKIDKLENRPVRHAISIMHEFAYTHWLLIQPPKGD